MPTVKPLQKMAFLNEKGNNTNQSPGWGESGSARTLGAGNAYPYLEIGKSPTINYVEDNSITTEAFQDKPRQVSYYVEKALSMNMYLRGINNFLYWAWGFENSIVEVVAFVVNTPTVEPTAGATYRDSILNDYTFLRKETLNSTSYWIFRAEGDEPPTQSDTLTKQTGTGDATLTVTAHSGIMFEHLYELAHERHFTDYRTDEQITGWASGYKKNRMATIGIDLINDHRYANAMCKKWMLSSSAGQLSTQGMDFCAYTEERGDYSSANWTLNSDLVNNSYLVPHHLYTTQLGAAEGSLVDLGVSSFEIGFDAPLQVLQDTVSGLYIAEPVMEGKYSCSGNMTLSRHSSATYQEYRDNWTSLVGRIASRSGYYMSEILIQDCKISATGPTDEQVSKEELPLHIGYSSSNNWSSWLYGNTLIQDGPLVMRVRNNTNDNAMLAN